MTWRWVGAIGRGGQPCLGNVKSSHEVERKKFWGAVNWREVGGEGKGKKVLFFGGGPAF